MSSPALVRAAVHGLLIRRASRDALIASLEEDAEHLGFLVAEMTAPPPEYAEILSALSLTAAQAAMLARLLRARGETVTYEALGAAIVAAGCSRADGGPSRTTVGVHGFRLRQRLAGSGIRVDAVYGIGLRAVVDHSGDAFGARRPASAPSTASSPPR